MHEWISDNQQTPHIVVDATIAGVDVPRQYVQDGKIILNVSLNATSGLNLGNDAVMFRARFGAATYDVAVPIVAVMGIYARETGQGMVFGEPEPPAPSAEPPPPAPPPSEPPRRGKATLKVLK
jgi:stringent starvation protein B